jgi:uncharacterized protein (DUF697 family)
MSETKRLRDESASLIIKNHMLWSMGAGFIPVPIVDFFAVGYLQLDMIRQLSKIYEIDFKEAEGKAIITSITSAGLAKVGAARAVKFIPVVGSVLGGVALSILSGASTYAVGYAFKKHFEAGGTFLDFDLNKLKKNYKDLFEKGKKVAKEMNQEQEQMRKAAKDSVDLEKKTKVGRDIIDEIKQLNQLKEDGILTEEEFNEMKKKIIS